MKRAGDKIIYTRAYVEALAERGESLHALLQEFVANYPADPRRWDAVLAMSANNRMFVKEIGDVEAKGFDAPAQFIGNAKLREFTAAAVKYSNCLLGTLIGAAERRTKRWCGRPRFSVRKKTSSQS